MIINGLLSTIIDYIDCNHWLIFIDWYHREKEWQELQDLHDGTIRISVSKSIAFHAALSLALTLQTNWAAEEIQVSTQACVRASETWAIVLGIAWFEQTSIDDSPYGKWILCNK